MNLSLIRKYAKKKKRKYADLGPVLPFMVISCIFQLTNSVISPIGKEAVPFICSKNISVRLQGITFPLRNSGIFSVCLWSSYSYPSVFNSWVYLEHILTDMYIRSRDLIKWNHNH